jgi:hypothetical protein
MSARRKVTKAASPIAEMRFTPDVDAVLWILARAAARRALREQAGLRTEQAKQPQRTRRKQSGKKSGTVYAAPSI